MVSPFYPATGYVAAFDWLHDNAPDFRIVRVDHRLRDGYPPYLEEGMYEVELGLRDEERQPVVLIAQGMNILTAVQHAVGAA